MIKLPQYTKKDVLILIGFLPVFAILLNYLLFGRRYFSDLGLFFSAGIITFVIMTGSWIAHTWVAVILRNRFSSEHEMVRRLAIAVSLFIIMTGITLTILFWGYDYFNFRGYEINETKYNWALVAGVLLNVLVTFVHESVLSFEKWRTTITETEQLKKEYMQGQLMGLKSQVSPHFLFNSLNSLSSLISDSPGKAEQFLNEMSKVYRYLLRNNEEKTVTLQTELHFVDSYYHLLQARYGTGVRLLISVPETNRRQLLPPLTLQILLDDIFKFNQISKDSPLGIDIYVNDGGWLEIKNNVQKKISDSILIDEAGIENVSKKCFLLCQQSIEIESLGKYRVIKVPLISPEQIPVT